MSKIIKICAGLGLALTMAACSTQSGTGKSGTEPVGQPQAFYGRYHDK
ncbi:hypothetical protein [Gluconobacter japonicus]|nr:hypothetical protein [Gluconobacter japonicus]